MQRLALVAVLAVLATPLQVSAAAWSTFQSKNLAFSIRYPSNWKEGGSPTLGPVTFQSGSMSMSIGFLPVKPASTIKQTVKRVGQYDQTFARVSWSRTTLGGRPSMAGVDSPSTEGGVAISDAVYIVGWRGRVYDVTLSSLHKPPYKRLQQFPAIYRQILSTWRFL